MADADRFAVLIDADNTSSKLVKEMFEELAGQGTLTVKRAYGDWASSQLSGWREVLLSNAILPQQQFAYTQGKNATDSALIIDAMDLLYSGNVEGFAIVSSDSDFTPLAMRLREAGKRVIGVGQRKTPAAFVEACERFVYLEVLGQESLPAAEQESESGRSLQGLLTRALNKIADEDDWATLGALGNHLVRTDPGFDPRIHGFAKLKDLVLAQPYLETVGESGRLRVRVKGRGAATARSPKKAATRATTKTAKSAKKTASTETRSTS
jgi:uncharacterized protein (TIGR00288 family)